MQISAKEKKYIFDIVETFITSFIVFTIIYSGVVFPEIVLGASMEPTLHTGERILVEKLSNKVTDYKRGEIVVFNPPGNDRDDYVKRIVGIPGDVIKIVDCRVYISNEGNKYVLSENYLLGETCTTGGFKIPEGRAQRIPQDMYVVLGDNRGNSRDSRNFGFVPKDRILGKAVFVFWPPFEAGFLN